MCGAVAPTSYSSGRDQVRGQCGYKVSETLPPITANMLGVVGLYLSSQLHRRHK
jgi:hypothetical protein